MQLDLNYFGIFMGIVMLISTGLGHIIVIKGEYHFGVKIWPAFLLIGVVSLLFSAIAHSTILSGILGIIGVTFLWGIHEVIKQKERVRKGWFPQKKSKR
jgi:hypothetical protein